MYGIIQVIVPVMAHSHLSCSWALPFLFLLFSASLFYHPHFSFHLCSIFFCLAPAPFPFLPSRQFLFPLLVCLIFYSFSFFLSSCSVFLLCLPSLFLSLCFKVLSVPAVSQCDPWHTQRHAGREITYRGFEFRNPRLDKFLCSHPTGWIPPSKRNRKERLTEKKKLSRKKDEKHSGRVNCLCKESGVQRQQDAGGQAKKKKTITEEDRKGKNRWDPRQKEANEKKYQGNKWDTREKRQRGHWQIEGRATGQTAP